METVYPLTRQLALANENAWLALGKAAEVTGDDDTTIKCYERAISHNRMNTSTLFNLACYYEKKEAYSKSAEHFRALISMNNTNGEAWSHLGYCLVQLNDLSAAYAAYQHALYHVQNPGRDPSLWYGIGLLYERYGSLDFAEDTFQAVLKMDPSGDIAWESHFRLAVIYKHRGKFDEALDRLRSIIEQTKNRDNAASVWTEIGCIHELKNEIQLAKNAYQKVIECTPHNVKAYQQLGWLCLKTQTDTGAAIDYLKQAVAADSKDGKGWYLLGRCYMSTNECEEAYYAYKEALALDANNPNIWCSLGVLFYQLGQYLDALDAYSRAINANPNICEVWYNVGTLYDTCNQTADARDAYQKAAELGADAQFIRERLDMLRTKENGQGTVNATTPPPSEPPTAAPMQSSTKLLNMYNDSLPGQLTATPATSNSMPMGNTHNHNRVIDRQTLPPPQSHLAQQLSAVSSGGPPSNWRMMGSGPNTMNRTPMSAPIMVRGMPTQQSRLQQQSSRGIPPVPGIMNIPTQQRAQSGQGQQQQRMPLLSQQMPRKLVPDELKRYSEDNRGNMIPMNSARLASMDPQTLANFSRDQQRDNRLAGGLNSAIDGSPLPGMHQQSGPSHMKLYKVTTTDG